MKNDSTPPASHSYNAEVAEEINRRITGANRIALISHRSPDGDTVGANLGLRQILLAQGKKVDSICVDPMPSAFRFLPGITKFKQELSPSSYDLIITVDAATAAQTGFDEQYPQLFGDNSNLINLDHHISNTLFAGINLVAADEASSASLIWIMAQQLGWSVNSDAATCLLNGLMTDTGSF